MNQALDLPISASLQQRFSSDKKPIVIGYGANLCAVKTALTSRIQFDFLVDDNPALWGQTLCGAPIRSSSSLQAVDWDAAVLILCAYQPRSLASMRSKILAMGTNAFDCSIISADLQYKTMGRRLRKELGITPDPVLYQRTKTLVHYGFIDNLSSAAGAWLFLQLLNHVSPGQSRDVAEMGVFKGFNALTALCLGPRPDGWTYHLFDSFQGLPSLSSHDPLSRGGEFRDVSLASVKMQFKDFENVVVHEGLFSTTLPSVANDTFSLVYVDCDLYEPTIECCEFFYRRLALGGVLLFHDYCEQIPDLPVGMKQPFTGVKKAVDEFANANACDIHVFDETTHAVMVRT